MKTKHAFELAGSVAALARLLEITQGAVSQWGEEVPAARVWQLRAIRPEWFPESALATPTPAEQGVAHG